MDSGINFKGVSFAYGEKVIFNELSLSIQRNRLTCLLGETGCGKTTILRLTAGLEVPQRGEIFLNDHLVANGSGVNVPASERNVGLIFQDLALWPHFTVYKNIAWGLRVKKEKHIEEKVFDMLDLLNIRGLSDRYPHQLSGGQQQLVALARSMILGPKILLLDEPLSNLDTKKKDKILSYILDLKQQFQITMVYVTHDHHDAERLADDIIVLNEVGEIAMSGGKEDVLGSGEV